ncbi:MAG: transposase [Chryseobacterium sp.]|uniref:helix-turn-helix domain-containing protein n=1 Tax=Chryseobacterium sp. TaxID=1871047 RepID=UPI0025C6F94B|nr:transposase [Chryseobacterium sp.]MCJ7933450.1 transposase [Chryseobacterium sp.]
MNFKDVHLGQMMQMKVAESGIEISRICNFLHCTEQEIWEMYKAKSLDSEILLKWSKLLEYDFFRIYSQHLILYAPITSEVKSNNKKSSLPKFRKNIYTKQIVDFILEQISSGNMTRNEVIERYRIPKTTLYKWISKYENK